MHIDDNELKKRLTPEQYHVLRENGTEPAFSGEYVNMHDDGSYTCRVCGAMLFKSDHKFDSKSGWPSFFDVADKDSVTLKEDSSHGMHRVEVRCTNCDSHLGHVFNDAPDQPTGMRFCINSAALKFNKEKAIDK